MLTLEATVSHRLIGQKAAANKLKRELVGMQDTACQKFSSNYESFTFCQRSHCVHGMRHSKQEKEIMQKIHKKLNGKCEIFQLLAIFGHGKLFAQLLAATAKAMASKKL